MDLPPNIPISVLFDKADLRRIKTTPLDNGYVVIETAAA
jgi:hypothetical protein